MADQTVYAIVGGAGFLGQHLLHLLLSNPQIKGSSIVIIDKAPFDRVVLMYPADFSNPSVSCYFNVDITQNKKLAKMLKGVDIVFHLAAAIAYGRKNKDLLFRVNTRGIQRIIESSEAVGVKKIIYVSSCAVLKCLDKKEKNQLTSEENSEKNWDEEKFCYYGRSKYDGEALTLQATHLNTAVVIPGILLGPGPCHHASILPFEIAGKKKWTLVPKGGSNYIDVRDVAEGLVALAIQPATKGQGRYLMVSHNLEHRELLQAIAGCFNRTLRFIELPRLLSPFIGYCFSVLEWLLPKKSPYSKEGALQAFRYRYFSYQKAFDELNWKPNHTLQETLEDTIHWLKKTEAGVK